MGITFQREFSGPLLHKELFPLLTAHYDEIAHFKDIKLKPAFDRYDDLEERGALRVFTAREDGRVVGYSIYIITHNLHYSDSLQALQDVLFLIERARAGLTGFKFIKWCDGELAADGVQVVMHHVKKSHDFSPVLERMGYTKIESVYARRL